MRSTHISAGALALLVAGPCLASPQPAALTERVQEEAMSCVGEAAQICPEVWTSEDHGVGCMMGKRDRFSQRCQVVYDDVARALSRR